jgi:hypothetical protein
MTDVEDSCVLVGGRKNLPKICVISEDTPAPNLRYRSSASFTPDGTDDPTNPNGSTPNSPANGTYVIHASSTPYSCTPTKFSSLQAYKTKVGPSPTLKDLQEGRVQLRSKTDGTESTGDRTGRIGDTRDSGYSGWQESQDTRKKLSFDPSFMSTGGRDSPGSPGDGSKRDFWNSFSSPVLDLKKTLKGRSSFLDESEVAKKWKIQPQHILAGIIVMILISSFGFALFIGVNHLSETGLNGKMKSILFGTEKRLQALKEEGRLIDRDIVDETGEVLGGKRASMQYAHQLAQEADALIDAVAYADSLPRYADASLLNAYNPLQEEESHLNLFELSASMEKMQKFIQDQDSRPAPGPTFEEIDLNLPKPASGSIIEEIDLNPPKPALGSIIEEIDLSPLKPAPKAADSDPDLRIKSKPSDPKPSKPSGSKPVSPKSKPVASQSKPAASKPEPATSQTKPVASKLKTGVPATKPGDPKAKPDHADSKPFSTKSKPRVSKLEPAEQKMDEGVSNDIPRSRIKKEVRDGNQRLRTKGDGFRFQNQV